MKIVNRGYIIVKAKQPFVNWANQQEEEFVMTSNTEPNVYLIEEDFFEIEPVIKQYFKKIFANELLAISEDESIYPDFKLEVFKEWFSYELGSTVFDTQKEQLQGE